MRLIIPLLCLVFILLVAGCAQHQVVVSPNTGAQKESASPTQISNSLETYPAPPQDNAVSAQINDKDQADKTIQVFFSGGKGQKMVRSSWIMIKRSDGSVERFELPPKAQSEVVLKGTDGEDQVRVYAEYYDGQIYQIADKSLRMRQRL
ncbi:hypothetical protein [Methanospirillum lacunae]|uniref:Uncharacterized protein n=1 Tax=Methanospirillum lacunae TaxID=668570 RepID=A0A2V2N9P3_9EURY|nr:hypothetical protein [Methanospirillum lacunae]PWR73198.1 hypothetical protein DK846_05055 [Methanospirillum lacunae]